MPPHAPNPFAISLADVQAAAERIHGVVHRTPLVPSEALSAELGCELAFKAENLQVIGAFKARGASNAVLALDPKVRANGVVTHSSGNHAAALARAASKAGVPAHIVMPENSVPVKLEAVRRLGVEPVLCEPTARAREAAAEELRARSGATLIHPFENPHVMAGQGTVALEILEQARELDAIVVPVGGGGLLSGTLVAAKALAPQLKIYAAEPAWADDTARSLASGTREPALRTDTIADGLRTPVGEAPFPIIQALLDDLLLVSEEEILSATRVLSERVHLVAEPSGAVPLAAIRAHAKRFAGQRVAAVISGGNLDLGACRLGRG